MVDRAAALSEEPSVSVGPQMTRGWCDHPLLCIHIIHVCCHHLAPQVWRQASLTRSPLMGWSAGQKSRDPSVCPPSTGYSSKVGCEDSELGSSCLLGKSIFRVQSPSLKLVGVCMEWVKVGKLSHSTLLNTSHNTLLLKSITDPESSWNFGGLWFKQICSWEF